MERSKSELIQFIEPVFRFCLGRTGSRQDAEDLAGEIMLHALSGLQKYEISSLEAWVWRVAHNRYARFSELRKRRGAEFPSETLPDLADDYDFVSAVELGEEYEAVFRCLHTLSSEYRDILVDYYIGQMPVKELSGKYSLPETTVKWRLNVSREKIRKRMGENKMDKVYKRINWETGSCNGSMDSDAYLSGQVARAICAAAYEKPLTVEEISLKTGLPAMYVEDALPWLLYGDAVEQTGKRYAASFIVLRRRDRAEMEERFAPLVGRLADYFEALLMRNGSAVKEIGFYGGDFGMERLGYIAVPYVIRKKIGRAKKSLGLESGPYPPRKDGGYGWFIVREAEDERDLGGKYDSGCNAAGGGSGHIYYYFVSGHFSGEIYHDGGIKWLAARDLTAACENGAVPAGLLAPDDAVRLLQKNLLYMDGETQKLNFPCFSRDQAEAFSELFLREDGGVEEMLQSLVAEIRKSFVSVVPKRLGSQINQWVSVMANSVVGYAEEELINRGALKTPGQDRPMTDGVFYIEGECISL